VKKLLYTTLYFYHYLQNCDSAVSAFGSVSNLSMIKIKMFTQSRQSARLFLQSSELGPPLPQANLFPPLWFRGDMHSLGGRGWGGGINILEDERHRIALLQ
jgi:hypothetical protein